MIATEIKQALVIGAGTMGHGIAHALAQAGIAVRLYDGQAGGAERGRSKIEATLTKGVSLGKVSQADAHAIIGRIAVVGDVAQGAAEVDLAIEAIPEIMAAKQALFAQLSTLLPSHAMLATNTSSLPVAQLAAASGDPERVIGLHFFNPVHLMKLVEIVRHPLTPDAMVETARELVVRLGKTPIVVRDSPGFASSRLGIALGLEAMRMVEEGVASPADIDTAMKLGYGHPMGPLELTDLVGLDVRLGISDYLASAIDPRFAAPDILRTKVSEGQLGKKSGQGFYEWTADGKRRG